MITTSINMFFQADWFKCDEDSTEQNSMGYNPAATIYTKFLVFSVVFTTAEITELDLYNKHRI